MYDDPKSKINQLEKILDAREDLVSTHRNRHELQKKDIDAKQDWDHSEYKVVDGLTKPPEKISHSSFSVKILTGSIIFFFLAVLIVVVRFFGGANLVSGNNIEIAVKAPVSVSGGEVFSFEIEIKNNNKVSLLGADLGITFPAGTKDQSDTALPAKRRQDFIGDILPGQTIKKNLSVVLFGEENEKKDIGMSLEYKIAGSNSLFNKARTVSVVLSSAPVSIVVSGPVEVNTNQTVDYNIEIVSNSPSIVKNLLLRVEYPFGFTFKSSNPKNYSKDNIWLVGDLEPGAKRTIKFSGVVSGQEGEERGFNFSLGSQSESDDTIIDVPFTSYFSAITIRRPFVSADILFNQQDTKEYVAYAGNQVETVIKWKNNLPYEVSNVSIMVTLRGNSLNKAGVQVDDGYYRSVDNTIIFDKSTNPELALLEAGQSGESKFSFSSFGTNTVTGSWLSNPTIVLDFFVNGRRVDYGSGLEDVLFSDSRKVKITADPQIFAKALYYVGPFQNSGPMPPIAEQSTTYTITWTVINPLNNLSNAVASATLPPYVKWLGAISPSNSRVDYDSSTGLVTWNIGNISAGAGSVSSAQEVSFQVSLLPSVDQIGKVPSLTTSAFMNAKDNFTLTPVSATSFPLDTKLDNDPYFKPNNETVRQ